MSLQGSTLWIAICQTVIAFSILLFAVGMTVAAFKLLGIVQRTLSDAKPTIRQATDTLKTVSDIAQSVEGRVDHIMHIAEDTAENVSKKVRTTSSMITETISPPLISASSVVTGVSRGLEIWSTLKKRGGNGRGS